MLRRLRGPLLGRGASFTTLGRLYCSPSGGTSESERNAAHIADTIRKYRRSESDTGSPEVQIAVMTERIRNLTTHMKMHRKDKATERSLVKMVHRRRSMMQYLLRKSPERYLDLVHSLGLRETTVFSKDTGVKGAKNRPTLVIRHNE